jgi:CRISPR/Cas system-associated protein Cas5 (RAMP superfamily)
MSDLEMMMLYLCEYELTPEQMKNCPSKEYRNLFDWYRHALVRQYDLARFNENTKFMNQLVTDAKRIGCTLGVDEDGYSSIKICDSKIGEIIIMR